MSVVVCTRNRITDLIKFLPTLAVQTRQPDELIIVDSSMQPIDQDALFLALFNQNYFPQTKLIYMHTQPGLTLQRNHGIAAASGDIIFFFDDDVTLSPNYLEIIGNRFAQNGAYAGGMGNVTNIKPYRFNLYRIFRLLFLLDRNQASGKFTLSGMPTHAYGNTAPQAVEVLGGCCMAFRNWALKKEKFDEELRFYGYMEDCDIAKRISTTYPLFYEPGAQMEHHESPLGRDRIRQNRAMFITNYSYLFFKNFYRHARWKIIFYAWTVTGLLLEGVLRMNKDVFFGYIHGLIYVIKTGGKLPYKP